MHAAVSEAYAHSDLLAQFASAGTWVESWLKLECNACGLAPNASAPVLCLQVSRSSSGASAPAVRTPTRSSGKYVEDSKQGVNDNDLKEAFEDNE